MFMTTEGKTLLKMMDELERVKPDFHDLNKVLISFDIDGATSEYRRHEGEIIHVEITELLVTVSGGGNTIKLPNYNHFSLMSMIDRAAEILLFEYDMEV